MSKPTTAPLFFRPDEYARAGAAAANAAPAAAWRQACGEAAAALQSPDSAAAAASAGALFAGDVAARALAVRILEAAARRGAGGGDSGGGAGAAATAAACGLADAPAQELAAQCEQHGEALRAALHLRVPSLPRLLALRTYVRASRRAAPRGRAVGCTAINSHPVHCLRHAPIYPSPAGAWTWL